jgi:hypothetical protein
MPEYQIRYLKRQELELEKWNTCIDESHNRLVYGYSSYLDTMSKNWDALVLNDYRAVMPLTWNKKWGIKYLYQPPFTQQLGIFSKEVITVDIINNFLRKLAEHFSFAEIFLNYKNTHPGLTSHTNFILDLYKGYETILEGYKYNLTRSLRLAKGFEFKYTVNVDLQQALAVNTKYYRERIKHLNDEDFLRFKKLCLAAEQKGELLVRAACDLDGQVLSVAVLLHKHERIYLLQSGTSKEGRKAEANYFLIDSIIREFSSTHNIFDFEGSDIQGIAHFYRLFGSVDQPYYFYRLNNLPWWFKWMKKRSSPIQHAAQS